MSVREYIGARYVPLFAEPLTWDATRTYEPLTVVLYQGNSYTSRQAVPANIDISNTTYWAQTGNYNAQIEQYRAEVQTFDGRIGGLENSLPSSAFNQTNTVKKYVDDSVSELSDDVDTEMQTLETSLNTAMQTLQTNVNNSISEISDTVETVSNRTPCEITRLGRLLFNTNNGNVGQCTFPYGDYWYSAGQDTLARFDSTGAMLNKITDTRIGHANGGFALDGNIYLCDGGDAKTIAEYSTVSLDFVRLYTFDRFSLLGISEYDGTIYGYGYDSQSEYPNPVIYTIDLATRAQTFVCQFMNMHTTWGSAFQDMCVYDGFAYIAGTDPNIIQKIDLTDGATVEVFKVPDGDGINPTNELESIYVKNGVMYITTGWYAAGFNVNITYTAQVEVFTTNVISPIVTNGGGFAEFVYNYIYVNEDAAQIFNPNPKAGAYTTIEEACVYANYHHGGYIYGNKCTKGLALLTKGNYAFYRIGTFTVDLVILRDSTLKTNSVSLGTIGLNGATFVANATGISQELYIENGTADLTRCYLENLSRLTLMRGSLRMHNFASAVNTAVVVTPDTSKQASFISYDGPACTGIMNLMYKCMRMGRVVMGTGGTPIAAAILQETDLTGFPTTPIQKAMSIANALIRFNADGTIQTSGDNGANWVYLNAYHYLEIKGY